MAGNSWTDSPPSREKKNREATLHSQGDTSQWVYLEQLLSRAYACDNVHLANTVLDLLYDLFDFLMISEVRFLSKQRSRDNYIPKLVYRAIWDWHRSLERVGKESRLSQEVESEIYLLPYAFLQRALRKQVTNLFEFFSDFLLIYFDNRKKDQLLIVRRENIWFESFKYLLWSLHKPSGQEKVYDLGFARKAFTKLRELLGTVGARLIVAQEAEDFTKLIKLVDEFRVRASFNHQALGDGENYLDQALIQDQALLYLGWGQFLLQGFAGKLKSNSYDTKEWAELVQRLAKALLNLKGQVAIYDLIFQIDQGPPERDWASWELNLAPAGEVVWIGASHYAQAFFALMIRDDYSFKNIERSDFGTEIEENQILYRYGEQGIIQKTLKEKFSAFGQLNQLLPHLQHTKGALDALKKLEQALQSKKEEELRRHETQDVIRNLLMQQLKELYWAKREFCLLWRFLQEGGAELHRAPSRFPAEFVADEEGRRQMAEMLNSDMQEAEAATVNHFLRNLARPKPEPMDIINLNELLEKSPDGISIFLHPLTAHSRLLREATLFLPDWKERDNDALPHQQGYQGRLRKGDVKEIWLFQYFSPAEDSHSTGLLFPLPKSKTVEDVEKCVQVEVLNGVELDVVEQLAQERPHYNEDERCKYAANQFFFRYTVKLALPEELEGKVYVVSLEKLLAEKEVNLSGE